ncbi:MAG TPA: ABC transporter ATP-binding protein [Acetobacteraceae bacterium]|nr:ABC transporter ATP-binding protein [Acetobacteraceae bacterium]
MSSAQGVTLTGVAKWYGKVPAVQGVDLVVRPGEMVSLLGPSGCGKTTTLRMIAGLEVPDAGEIRIGDRVATDIPPWRRNIGMVFQNYALFPHKSVAENIAYGLVMRRVPRAEIATRVADTMRLVRLEGLDERTPSQLSGGQRQRVALARAIITRPDVLLFDEPLAALDRKLREQMQVEIKLLQREVGITTIFVTHDQDEALTLSDRIVVMDQGRIVQTGTPAEIYDRPRSHFVSDFIGMMNALRGTVAASDAGGLKVRLLGGQEVPVPGADAAAPGSAIELMLRPEKVLLDPAPAPGVTRLDGTVTHIVYMGAVTYLHVAIGGGATMLAMLPNTAGAPPAPQQGSAVTLGWRDADLVAFAAPKGA